MGEVGESKVELQVRRVRWIARGASVLIIAFALFIMIGHLIYPDPYAVEDYPPIENWMPIVMMLSVLSLALCWKWERFGGVLSLAFFVLHLCLFWAVRGWFFPIEMILMFSPIPITALLFIYAGWPRQVHL